MVAEDNQAMIVGLEGQVEELKATIAPIQEYVEPALVEGAGAMVYPRSLLDRVRALPDAMRQVERSSVRGCVIHALSTLLLHYPFLDMRRITMGLP